MKKSEVIQDIASVLIDEQTNFMPYDKAQELAEKIIDQLTKKRYIQPKHFLVESTGETYNPDKHFGMDTRMVDNWEPENE